MGDMAGIVPPLETIFFTPSVPPEYRKYALRGENMLNPILALD